MLLSNLFIYNDFLENRSNEPTKDSGRGGRIPLVTSTHQNFVSVTVPNVSTNGKKQGSETVPQAYATSTTPFYLRLRWVSRMPILPFLTSGCTVTVSLRHGVNAQIQSTITIRFPIIIINHLVSTDVNNKSFCTSDDRNLQFVVIHGLRHLFIVIGISDKQQLFNFSLQK